ncbi:MAG: Ig-like domain-containing protein, partial [Cytophagales bacterium]
MIDFQIGAADNRRFSNQIIDWLASAGWISLADAAGEVLGTKNSDISVLLNASGLSVGTYTANIAINSNDPIKSTVSVPVSMTVTTFINTPPVVSKPISDQLLKVSKTFLVKLDTIFSDVDKQPLVFEASSTNSSIASVTLSGSSLIINAPSPGDVVINVMAKDSFNAQVTTTFKVKVYSNQAPVVANTIANQNLRMDKTFDINLAQVFADPDGQTLTFSANSSSGTFVSYSLIGSLLKITPKALGSTTFTLRATDTYNEFVTTQFTVTVVPKNEPPFVANPIGIQSVRLDKTLVLDISKVFADPEGQALTYTATIAPLSVASVSLATTTLTITPKSTGQVSVTLAAMDIYDDFTVSTITATVLPANQAPTIAKQFQEIELKIIGGKKDSAVFDLTTYFGDINSDV